MEKKKYPKKGQTPNKEAIKDKLEVNDLVVAKKILQIYQSSIDRKLEFNLSFEYVKKLLSYSSCYYTNRKFEEDGLFARSFDRIDSNKGYVEGNVVSCTVDINGKKSNLSVDEIECLYKKLVIPYRNSLPLTGIVAGKNDLTSPIIEEFKKISEE